MGVLPDSILLHHKPPQGRVDLTVAGRTVEGLRAALHSRLPLGVLVAPAGRWPALRMVVPHLDHLRPYVEQEEKVLASLAAVEGLHRLGQSLPARIPSGG